MAAQREWFETNYYEVLGVSPESTPKEITRAYRKLARELHPDKNPGNSAAEERFKSVSAAYDVLGDETKRAEYDEVRRLGPMAAGGGPGGFSFNVGDMDGFGDLFSQMFSSGRSRGAGGGPRRGADQTTTLTLSFVDAAHGVTTSLNVVSEGSCGSCGGSGAKAGTPINPCGVCNGRGVVDDNQGPFSFSSPCRQCHGRGRLIERPCEQCGGLGTSTGQRSVNVRIPAGVNDRQTIRLKGKGAPGRNGGPAGDLLVEIHVTPHPRFSRDGDNLHVSVPVTFAEAALGADIDVPTLEGDTVRLRVRPGTQSGSRHRVGGRGITTSKRGQRDRGDLIVRVVVDVPREIDDEQRAAIERLAEVFRRDPRNEANYDGESS